MLTPRRSLALILVVLPLLPACREGDDAPATAKPQGMPVAATLTAEQQREVDRLQTLLRETTDLTAEALLARRAVPGGALGYDPATAVNLNLIQASALRLDGAEMAAMSADGFVISDKRRYPHFAYGYKTIYGQDLPVFISADSILQAVHQSYDEILKAVETAGLIPELGRLLTAMNGHLAASTAIDAVTRRDADLFLTVAASLLEGKVIRSPANLAASEGEELFALAQGASGSRDMTLFGVLRAIDFSQFKPRGHYTHTPELERYFRAMMWLGRIDFPLIRTDAQTGERRLVRRSVSAALALRGLMDAESFARWTRIDQVVRGFVGEPDSMAPPEVDALKATLGLTSDALDGVSDETLAQAIIKGAYGHQKILSQIVIQAPHEGTWPLDATFLFFGQRYVFDSHVFSNVVYDRVNVAKPGVPKRMMPNPLDAAYAALGNDRALALLAPELRTYEYAGALESMRRLGDEHTAAFWDANLYNLWLSALRVLSPGGDAQAAGGAGLPAVAATERWSRRILNTQLASWAQLRHDTILYAKPSYTSGVACEFPDAYVEPYPAFFARLETFASAGAALVATLPVTGDGDLAMRVAAYFGKMKEVMGILREMAEHQRTGTPHTAAHLAFINRAVDLNLGCGGPPSITGWYSDLFFQQEGAGKFDPTIADVHTQPTDAAGTFVGRVLHVGTGQPRLMVVTVETCAGPRAYAGVVSSYHELVTKDLERLDDPAWARKFTADAIPADVDWMNDVVVR